MGKFYVYMLFDWLGIPRYVGKGQGRREDAREKISKSLTGRQHTPETKEKMRLARLKYYSEKRLKG